MARGGGNGEWVEWTPGSPNGGSESIPMNLYHSSNSVHRFASMCILITGFAAASAFAGPCPKFWLIERAALSAKSAKTPAKPERCPGCNGVKTVEVAVTKPAWRNGRGPLTTTTEMQTRRCSDCAGAVAERKPEWPNGRGPLHPVVTPEAIQTPIAVSANDRRG